MMITSAIRICEAPNTKFYVAGYQDGLLTWLPKTKQWHNQGWILIQTGDTGPDEGLYSCVWADVCWSLEYGLGRLEDQYMRACSRYVDIDMMRDGGLKYGHGCSLGRNLNQNFLITEMYSNEPKLTQMNQNELK